MEPFRNDHDATLARADALDVELVMTRRELADAHARIDTLEHRATARPAGTAVHIPPRPWAVMVGLVIGAAILAFAGWVFVRATPMRPAADPDTALIEPAPAPAAAFDPDTELACPLDEPYVP
jgi:hypothetical protein